MSYNQCFNFARKHGRSINDSHEFASFVMGYRMAAPFWRKTSLDKLYKLFKEYVVV